MHLKTIKMNHPNSPSTLNRARTGETAPLDGTSNQEGTIRFSDEKYPGGEVVLLFYCD